MKNLEIKVEGSASVSHVAERGVLSVMVNNDSTSQEECSENVRETANDLQNRFRQLAPKDSEGRPAEHADITHFSTTSLRTSSDVPYRDAKREERRYHASLTFEIYFQNFTKLGEMASELLKKQYVTIQSTTWMLNDSTRRALGSDVRKRALREAIQKADDYAEVLERKVEPVKILADKSQAWSQARFADPKAMRLATGDTNTDSSVTGLAVQPQDIQVTSSVLVTFVAQGDEI